MSETTNPERPPFPDSGVCVCGGDEWQDVEFGYSRCSSAEIKTDKEGNRYLSVFMDGWDDMSEGGDDHCVQCAVCFAEYSIPDDLDIDYA